MRSNFKIDPFYIGCNCLFLIFFKAYFHKDLISSRFCTFRMFVSESDNI